jgi:tetratricopeptide (TPR) repeat protein
MLVIVALLFPEPCWPQGGESTINAGLRTTEQTIWNVFGRVTDVRGNPLHDVKVRLIVAGRAGDDKLLRTNLKGEFQQQFSLEADMFKKVTVRLIASKDGFAEARETVTLAPNSEFGGLNVILRRSEAGADEVPIYPLVGALGVALREGGAQQLVKDQTEWARGCDELIRNHNAAAAIAPLLKVVDHSPGCIECRTLLSLAMLQGGSWTEGTRQLEEALKLNEKAAPRRPEPLLVAGSYRGWRGDREKAGPYFKKALEIAPGHPLALQETGRLFFEEKDYGAADQLLEKALAAGAGPDARLLRIRALLELGDVQEASREMDTYVGGRDPKTLPMEGREVYLQVRDRLEVAPFSLVKSVIEQSAEELVKGIPELQGLRPAPSQEPLPSILARTGEGVDRFVRNFPNTISLEKVHQERLDKDGKVRNSLDQEFQYILLARKGEWGLGLEENRSTALGQASSMQGYAQGFVLTSGFSACSWVFHPANQPATRFRYLGDQTINGKEYLVVAFAQKPETTRLKARFSTEEGSAPMLFQGVVWVDPENYQIVRLRNDLLSPLAKLRLQRLTTEIRYHQISFKEVARAFWVPEEISVTLDLRGRLYRNMHSYSDFRLFNVEATEELKPGSIPGADGPKSN